MRECAIAILDAHGAKDSPDFFRFSDTNRDRNDNGCGAFMGCYPHGTNSLIPPSNSVPNAPDHNEMRNRWRRAHTTLTSHRERDALLDGAKSRAKEMCGTCKRVRIVITDAPRPTEEAYPDLTLELTCDQGCPSESDKWKKYGSPFFDHQYNTGSIPWGG